MPLRRVGEILEFLTAARRVIFEKSKLAKIKPWPHIIHYSSAITLSAAGVYRIKRKLLEALRSL